MFCKSIGSSPLTEPRTPDLLPAVVVPPLLDDPRSLGLELLGCFPHTHRTRIDLAAQALAERRQGLNVTLAAVLALIRSQDVVAAGSWQ